MTKYAWLRQYECIRPVDEFKPGQIVQGYAAGDRLAIYVDGGNTERYSTKYFSEVLLRGDIRCIKWMIDNPGKCLTDIHGRFGSIRYNAYRQRFEIRNRTLEFFPINSFWMLERTDWRQEIKLNKGDGNE